jgi:hypothetical protein
MKGSLFTPSLHNLKHFCMRPKRIPDLVITPSYAEIAAWRFCVALADTPIFQRGRPRELEKVIAVRGRPAMHVSDTLELIIRDALASRNRRTTTDNWQSGWMAFPFPEYNGGSIVASTERARMLVSPSSS